LALNTAPSFAQLATTLSGVPGDNTEAFALRGTGIQEPKPTQRSCGERPADWRGDRRSQGVGRLMALTMRRAGLSSGIDQDRADYTVYRGGPDPLRWFWSFTITCPMTRSDRVSTFGRGQGAVSEEQRREGVVGVERRLDA